MVSTPSPSKTVKIFVASPSDVAVERERIDLVAARLNTLFEGIVKLETYLWERDFFTANLPFQEAIDKAVGGMSAMNIVISIVWSRVGSELSTHIGRRNDGTPYESGTVYEVEHALEASRQNQGIPDVYLFRKSEKVRFDADEFKQQAHQYELLKAVWKRWTETPEGHNQAAFHHFSNTDDFERQIEDCLRQWLTRHGFAPEGAEWNRNALGSPFCDLSPFDGKHAPVFFGRDNAIAKGVQLVRDAAAKPDGVPFLLIVGSSGAGKSSLLRAGLMNRLVLPGAMPGIDALRPVLVTPGPLPLLTLADALLEKSALGAELAQAGFTTPALLASSFAGDPDAAIAPLMAALARTAQDHARTRHYVTPRPARLLIGIDQLEGLFAEAGPEDTRRFTRIINALVEANVAIVLAALRNDGYAAFQKNPDLLILKQQGAVLDLLPPDPSQIETMVRRPVSVCTPTLSFEQGDDGQTLDARIIQEAQSGGVLPLLQMTLSRLYDAQQKRGDSMLRFQDYTALGGITGVVATAAEQAMAPLSEASRTALQALIREFVSDIRGDGDEAVLIVHPVAQDAFIAGKPERLALIDALVEARLLMRDQAGSEIFLRPVHDALFKAWQRAAGIVAENRELIRLRHTLEPIAQDWTSAQQTARDGFLITSHALLGGAERLMDTFEQVPEQMQGFIRASLDKAKADRERRIAEVRALADANRRTVRRTLAGLVIALGLAGLAGWQWIEVGHQRDRAEQALATATQTANTLIFDLAQNLRNKHGIPQTLIHNILNRARALTDELTGSGESNPELKRAQAAALLEIAETLLTIGDTQGAGQASRKSVLIIEQLADSDPGNAGWQRDLSVSYSKLGDVLLQAGERDQALLEYRKALKISAQLADSDPGNAGWQRDLSVSFDRVGDVLLKAGQRDQALKQYQKSLNIRQQLADSDPGNAGWQTDLVASYYKMANAGLAPIENLSKALTIVEKLAEQNRLSPQQTAGINPLKQQLSNEHNNRAWEAFLDGNYAAGLPDVDRALELSPDFAEALDTRANISLGLSNADGAIADFTQAIEKGLSQSITYYGRGQAYERKGFTELAVADYHKAVSLKAEDDGNRQAAAQAQKRLAALTASSP